MKRYRPMQWTVYQRLRRAWFRFAHVTWPRISYLTIEGCERCGNPVSAYRDSMTSYHFDGVEGSASDPNRPRSFCDKHAEEYHAHWAAMWDEYYSSQLGWY